VHPLKRLLSAACAVLCVGIVTLPASGLDVPLPGAAGAACTTAPLAAAAGALLGPAAELVADEGDTALALVPGVHPGIRQRLVAAGDVWCPADLVNTALALRGTTGAVERATTAAEVLAAAHFDRVTVLDAAEVSPGEVHLTTHALTNGVVADWVVAVDDAGIRSAEWTATRFAVPPLEAQIEGLTALPGATMGYERTPDGRLVPTTDVLALGLAQLADDPSPTISVTAEDGFTMHVVVGDATFYPQAANSLAGTGLPRAYGGAAPDPGVDTGDAQVDYLRIMAEGLEVNYADFLDWGYEQGWVDDEGNLYVDGALSAYCLACVLVSEYFNIHMSRAAHEALGALGYSYPDTRLALLDIVGHEMFHNLQNAYGKPDTVGGARHNSYSEGTARMQETLHSYSAVSHQPESLVYANDTNGCNGWQGSNADAAFAAGPLTGQSYDACYFWLTFYGRYGLEALVELLPRTVDLQGDRQWGVYDDPILQAARASDPDATLTDVLTAFAASALTGRGYTWGAPADEAAPALDWAAFLDRWEPDGTAGPGDALGATLRDGGMAAFQVREPLAIGQTSTAEGHAVALVVDDGSATTTRTLAPGDVVELPSGGTAWIVLMNSSTTSGEVSAALLPPSA
jgi:hypothetical protein